MFKLPRVVGKTPEGEEITANIGRFGPYVNVGKLFVSLKEHDPLTISEADAVALIKIKQQAEKDKIIADFGKLKILNGPYGPYATDGKVNVRIPKTVDPKKLKEADAQKLVDNPPPKRPRGRRKSA